MPSGKFQNIPLDVITVPEDRQRKEFNQKALDDLIESIRARGLLNPIIVTEDLVLVAGERRLRAFRALGFDVIPSQFVESLSSDELTLIEFDENIRRSDLTWQERISTVAKFHKLKSESDPEWNKTRTCEALNISGKDLADFLLTHEALVEGIKEVVESPKQSSAIAYARRRHDRRKAAETREATSTVDSAIEQIFSGPDADEEAAVSAAPDEPEVAAPLPWQLDNLRFNADLPFPHTKKINLLHCDFPYGVGATKSGQSSAKSHGGYSDEESDYWTLIDQLATFSAEHVADSAHMIFWFSMNFYEETRIALTDLGWRVFPLPLIWGKSNNRGIIFDANRYPRNIYETAFLCARGDRQLVRAKNNVYWGPTTKEYHMSEKPHAMLTHFMSMLVDEFTVMYDPTCGSAMSVRVASELGAEFAYGTEMNPDFYEEALRNLEES